MLVEFLNSKIEKTKSKYFGTEKTELLDFVINILENEYCGFPPIGTGSESYTESTPHIIILFGRNMYLYLFNHKTKLRSTNNIHIDYDFTILDNRKILELILKQKDRHFKGKYEERKIEDHKDDYNYILKNIKD